MVHHNTIRAYARRIAREFKPRAIVLFGSYAYGRPTEDSDVDLLVVMPHKGRSVKQALDIRLRLRAPFPLDLLVRSPRTLKERMEMGDCFVREIMEKGRILYEARDERMGGQG
ncbi:MAG: nucleotidyltransferase domain-containing protein [Candidatus Sumerlaeota bacterium]|nr:nucleotidyltransferase domain-containing protein [Candidatus Sumerlaeota bacterium]